MSKNLTLNIEQIKKDKDGLDVLSDIYIYAVLGERVSQEDLVRFKWYGIHAQEESKDLFELKIPLPLGQLTLEQIKTLSLISKEYAKNSLDISKEQKIELKNLKIHDLPHVFNLLHNVNLSTIFESGHNVRNVITCPVNGIDATQIADVSELAQKLNKAFIGNKNFSNLPNKLQIAVSGYAEGCALDYTPEVSFNAHKNEKGKILFSVKVIGEHLGFVTPSQVVNTARAIAKIYKDFGNREDVEDSSFQSLVGSWGFVKFFDILDSSVTFRIKEDDIDDEETVGRQPRLGINESKVDGQSYIGCVVKNSQIGSAGLEKLANLLEKYDASKIKLTHKGNIVILDAPTKNADEFAKELHKVDFNPFN